MPNPKANPVHSSGVDADRGEDGGVDHAAAAELDPPGLRAGPASRAVADRAGDVELGRGLGEGEVARPPSRVNVGPEVRGGEDLDGAGQVGEGDAAVDDQALDLVEDSKMTGVGRVPSVAAPWHHRVDGQQPLGHRLFHQVDLYRRGVGAEQHRLRLTDLEVEAVPHAPCRVSRGDVEGAEVVPIRLDFGALGHLEAHAHEDILEHAPGPG